MNRLRRLGPFALLMALACSASNPGTPNADTCLRGPWNATFGRHGTLQVAIADTEEERAQGLMGVTKLPDEHGMAFTWDAPTEGSFWMKDTLIPLSIAFVGADGRIVTLQDMTPCESDPCPTYAATEPYVTAIEANAGWFATHHIEVGDDVGITQQACS